jgi:hypothetical protein
MEARKIVFGSIAHALRELDRLGSSNSLMMASRAIHVNIMLTQIPGPEARFLKTVYNDIGAEAAISNEAYYESDGAVTDMVIMGTVYQHREVKRILADNNKMKHLIDAIADVLENSPEVEENG